MDAQDIRKAALEAIATIVPEAGLRPLPPDQPLRAILALDSMDWLNVVVALHDRLGVDIPESDYARLETLDSAVAYLAERAASPGNATPPAAAPTADTIACTRHRVGGRAVVVRPMRREDLPLEAAFVRHLSSESRYKRFMTTIGELSEAKLRYLTDVDQRQHVALVATVETGAGEVEIGVARYIVDPAGKGCEFAIAVDDAWQGSGVAGILMHALIAVARTRGLATMEGIVLAANARMLRFARQLGFQPQRDPDDLGSVRVVLAL